MQIYEILCIDFVWKRNLGKERSWFSCRSFPFGASRTRAQSASVMRAMVRGDFFISLDNRVYRKLAGSPLGQQISDRRKAIIGTNVLCVNLKRDTAAWWGCRRWKFLCEPLSREKQERMSGVFITHDERIFRRVFATWTRKAGKRRPPKQARPKTRKIKKPCLRQQSRLFPYAPVR